MIKMKRIGLILIACLAYFTPVSAQHNITFKVNGQGEGDAIVAFYYGESQRALDTIAFTADGVAVMQGKDKVKNGIYLLVLPDRTYFEFIIPDDDQEFTFYADTSMSIDKQKVKGSRDNEAFIKYNQYAQQKGRETRDLQAKIKDPNVSEEEKKALREQLKSISTEVIAKRNELAKEYDGTFISRVWNSIREVDIPEELKDDTTGKKFDYYRQHYWDNFDFSDDGMVRTPIYHGRMEYFLTKMYAQVPDTVLKAIDHFIGLVEAGGSQEQFKYSVWWVTRHYEDSKIMCMDKVLHHMAKDYYCAGKCFWADSSTVAKMCEHADKIGKQLCGEMAPDMTLADTSFKKQYSLHSVDAPVTILLFWDHQCGHCKKEVPKINRMMDSMAAKGVVVYAVYTQGDWEGWKEYIRKNKLQFLNVMDAFNTSTYRDDYHIISTPQLYLLNRNKQIMFKQVPAENLPEIINYLLEEDKEQFDDTVVTPGKSN